MAQDKRLKRRKKIIGFSVDAKLDAEIEQYARDNGISKSGAMRSLIIRSLRISVNSSKLEREVAQ